MPHPPTKYFKFRLPTENDPMSVPNLDITANFQKIQAAGELPIMGPPGPLPQTGPYEVGDKAYIGGGGTFDSCFIVCAKNDAWGIWWRPVQDQTSPWAAPPATAFFDNDYETHPTYPWQICLDNRGRIHHRGAIRKKTGGVPNNTSIRIFEYWPEGLQPPAPMNFPVALDPIAMANPTDTTAFKGGRFTIFSSQDDGYSGFRFHNAAANTTDIWMHNIRYVLGQNDYTQA